MNSIFETVWKSLSSEFDLTNCVYKNIDGRVFIHFPKVEDCLPVRVKITRNAQEDKTTLYEALDSVIVAWLSNSNSTNKNVCSRMGPNKTWYSVINFLVNDCEFENGIPIIDCRPPRNFEDDLEFDDDWNCNWKDEDDPEAYYIDEDGVKVYKWTKNWADTFEDDFD